jgi:two-component sensor histidine kinase/PAS domain-containing protein
MRLMTKEPKTYTIRGWLALLAIAFLLPSIAASSFLIWDSGRRERANLERATIHTTRVVLQAVDRELANLQGTAQALATSPYLQMDDFASFYVQAQQAMRNRPGIGVALIDSSGRQRLNTRVPFSTKLPPASNQRQLAEVFATGKPGISDLYTGSVTRLPKVSIDVPVWLNGAIPTGNTPYVLSLDLSADHFTAILQRSRLPEGWIVGIRDSMGTIIARDSLPGLFVGQQPAARPPPDSDEGSLGSQILGGVPVFITYSRSKVSKWLVIIGVPQAELNRALWFSIALGVGGELLCLAVGLALARLIGKRIATAIRSLAEPTLALGTGAPVRIVNRDLQEVNDIGQALVNAAELINTRTVERDRAESAEREIRLVTQQMETLYHRLMLATKAADIAIWEWDVKSKQLTMDQRMLALYKITLELGSVGGSMEDHQTNNIYKLWRQHVHPDDIVRLEQDMLDAVASGKPLSSEFRIVWPNGQIRIIRADAVVSRDPTGQTQRMTGINLDITDSKQQQAVNAALREKETMLKELYHRVKNNLQVITSLFNLQARSLPEGEARTSLQEAANRVRAMALVHEKFYQSGNLAEISLDQYIIDLCRQVSLAAAADKLGVCLRTEVEPVQVSLETAIPLGLILNELISNCMKHAFQSGGKGKITVSLRHVNDGVADADTLLLMVSDDGIGLGPDFNRTSFATLGLRLVAGLTKQLDGRFSLESQGGTDAKLYFNTAQHAYAQADADRSPLPDD